MMTELGDIFWGTIKVLTFKYNAGVAVCSQTHEYVNVFGGAHHVIFFFLSQCLHL